MSQIAKRTISLTAEHSNYIEEKVKSGAYASASEVVRNGLRALQERDEVFEKWLSNDVLPVYERAIANPNELIDGDEVFDEILKSS